jgi:hypothetical protein
MVRETHSINRIIQQPVWERVPALSTTIFRARDCPPVLTGMWKRRRLRSAMPARLKSTTSVTAQATIPSNRKSKFCRRAIEHLSGRGVAWGDASWSGG